MTQPLLTANDVAMMLGISRQRVGQLVRRRPDFPRPAVETHGPTGYLSARFWHQSDIERWKATTDRTPGRRAQPKVAA